MKQMSKGNNPQVVYYGEGMAILVDYKCIKCDYRDYKLQHMLCYMLNHILRRIVYE